MISNEAVCEPLQDITSRVTSIACSLYRQFGSSRERDFYREQIRLFLSESEIDFQFWENVFSYINALSFFLPEHRILLTLFHKKAPTRFQLREMKNEVRDSAIKSILVVVLRDWGVTIRKLEIYSESG